LILVLKGILAGIILAVFVGPSFFYLVRVGVNKGFKAATIFASGIFASDATLVILMYLGFKDILNNEVFQKGFALVAGALILAMGIKWTFGKTRVKQIKKMGISSLPALFIKGFALNFLNPFTILLWITVLATVGLSNADGKDYLTFFLAALLTIFTMDILKAWYANVLGNILNEKLLGNINRILGIIFIVMSIRFLWFFYEHI
jgi:threonine/homoserine/homoserine lactone efflux protein